MSTENFLSSKPSADQPSVILSGGEPSVALAFPDAARARIASRANLLNGTLDRDHWQKSRNELARADYILGTWGVPQLTEEFLSAAPKLKGVFYAAGSIKGFATEASYNRGIIISSAWAANGIPVAEYTLATILLSLKNFWNVSRATRADRAWNRSETTTGAYGAVVGIVSLGAIGKFLVHLLRNFDLKVIAYDPFLMPETAAELGVEVASLDEVFERSDVVTLHTPWLPETEGLINRRLIEKMKPGATLINTSRGAVLNETDLCNVLAVRTDLTAILDVTHPEPPPPESALYDLPNIIQTPHIAGSLGNEVGRMGNWMVDEFFRQLDGEPLRHAVTHEMLASMA